MGKKSRLLCGAAMAVFLSRACFVKAATTTYDYFYVAGQSSFNNIAPGSTLNVPLYIEEVSSDGSSNSLLAREDGLFGAGTAVSLFSRSGGPATTITAIVANSGSPTSGFDQVLDQSNTSTSAALLEGLNFSDADGVAATPQVGGVSTIFLGNLSLLASSSPGETSTFQLTAYDSNSGNTVTFANGYDLDNNADPLNPSGASDLYFDAAATTFSVTTTSVPEPSGLLVIGTIAALILVHRPVHQKWKNRRLMYTMCSSSPRS